MKNKAFFLDRDGVINAEVDYLSRPEDVIILPGVAAALNRIRAAGYLAIVVTNQSGVARGMYGEEDIHRVHAEIARLLAQQGAAIDGWYYCIHHKDFNADCDCRKPKPGMLTTAARDHDIDLAASVMIGDRTSDLEAGRAAGCRAVALVRTGYGANVIAAGQAPAYALIADDLAAAVEMLL